jgi:nucleotide-binding universal stress UspA family protein
MRTILLNINPDPGHEARLAAAISLAKSQSGHINCLQTIIQPLAIGDPESAVVVPEMMEAVEWSARAFREAVEARLEAAGVEWSWGQLYGDPATIIVSHARLADVVILSAEGYYPSVGSVALHARIPILAMPEKGVAFHVQPPALIAWNGSHPAANALRASLPLLRNGGAVHVLVVGDDSEKFPAARALDYLSHHAITAEGHWVRSDSKTVAETILTLAGRIEAGLVVAGAFGHNRIREMLLGSVTRALVKDSPLPLLLAH